ncbi:Glutathione S-transferase S1 [Linnemannia zychae]|nr:Glutathione S-transferase S1 [Linnemannia zychae]
MVHAYFDPAQRAEFNALARKTDSTFVIKYFGLHGLGGVCRTILALSGNKFTAETPEDWATEKPKAPFGVMPLLTEISADGAHTLQVAESDAIERYLSHKFGLLGQDEFENVLVNTFVSSTQSLQNQILFKYSVVKEPELKAAAKEPLVTKSIIPWVEYHEKHLKENNSNGHYVGNKVTLADIKTDFVIGLIQSVTGEDLVSESKTPAIWEVRKKLNEQKHLMAWKATDEYKALSEKNLALLGFP